MLRNRNRHSYTQCGFPIVEALTRSAVRCLELHCGATWSINALAPLADAFQQTWQIARRVRSPGANTQVQGRAYQFVHFHVTFRFIVFAFPSRIAILSVHFLLRRKFPVPSAIMNLWWLAGSLLNCFPSKKKNYFSITMRTHATASSWTHEAKAITSF